MPKKIVNASKPIEVWFSGAYRDAINEYMHTMQLQNPSDAVRDLVIVALASLPEEGVISALRMRVFNQVRRAAFAEMNAFFNDFGRRLEKSIDNPNVNPEDV